MRVINVPNLISLIRLLMAPTVLWLIIRDDWAAAFYIFLVASVSDAVDGFIAKRFGSVTQLGKYLDPIADKVLLVSVYLALGHSNLLPLALVILVVSRDFLIIGGALLLYTLETRFYVQPSMISKVNTFAQLLLAALAMAAAAFGFKIATTLTVMCWLTALTTVLSGTGYLIEWGRRLSHTGR